MLFYLRLSLFLLFFSLSVGCSGKSSYNIQSDAMIVDLNTRIGQLQEDLTTLTSEIDQVRVVLNDNDIAVELKKSIRKEILEGERYQREIEQWISYLKVQRKQRYASLHERKDQNNLKEQALAEVGRYNMQKELKPIKTPWKNRYKTAIEL